MSLKDYWRSCANKRRFQNKQIAVIKAMKLAKRFRTPFAVYHCRYCKGFHITRRL